MYSIEDLNKMRYYNDTSDKISCEDIYGKTYTKDDSYD